MPLDRDRVLPPKSMYDMIEKMWEGKCIFIGSINLTLASFLLLITAFIDKHVLLRHR